MKKILAITTLVLFLVSCWWNETSMDDTNNESTSNTTVSDIQNTQEEDESLEVIDEILFSIDSDSPDRPNEEENDQQELSTKTFDCDWAYNDLITETRTQNIKKFWEDYNTCYFEVDHVGCEKSKDSNKIVNYEIILDYSQSMLSKISWETRMDIAKQSLEKFVSIVDTNTNVWLLAYGHKGWSDCKDIEQLVSIGKDNREDMIDKMKSFGAKWYTPIGKSLRIAWETLSQYKWDSYENHILLISDWVESCKWNPVAEAEELLKQNIVISVIGFDVNNEVSASLKQIADTSGGMYYLANNMEELEKSLRDFEENHSCYMDKAMNNLENSLNVQSEAFDCLHSLEMEKGDEILNINLSEYPAECKKTLTNRINIRYIQLKKKIEANKQEAMNKVEEQNNQNTDDFNNNIKDIQNTYDIETDMDMDFDMDYDF